MPQHERGTRSTPGDTRRWGLAVVRGDSMLPTLRAGDRLLVSYRRGPRVGDVVVARFADGTVAVKRAAERRTTRAGAPGWWLLSDNAGAGVDSRHRGVVADGDVRAVTVARIWPRPRLLARAPVRD
ncbi:S24/S26 family peptidase [Nocardioides sp. YIM 152315]|uniref:S24/S26 family peptidase n=1 Tax=Nocardioides sp. YIM 152315 TaxID=3031760 RepID=UPI0023DBA176|nr:S24/S26 family peptidase [Nocardioides sp. YIM 152315]MDF1603721.1 S24/S26 family peptidase [Nocardioides sp. YIM 152315]